MPGYTPDVKNIISNSTDLPNSVLDYVDKLLNANQYAIAKNFVSMVLYKFYEPIN